MASFPTNHTEWLKKLVSFDTTSRNSNLALQNYVRDYFKSLGIDCTFVYNPQKTHANLFATLPASDGTTQGGIILSGHTDVVPVDGQKWNSDPFVVTERDGKLYGRGTCDMKGFLAVALALAPTFLKMKRALPVHYALSFDEEVGCTGVPYLTKYLKEKGFKADYCQVGDGFVASIVTTGNKGLASWIVKVHGQAIHSSMALMNTSCNAIEYAALIIAKIRQIAVELKESGPRDENYTCPFAAMSTGLIKGGNAVNTVPADCEFTFSVRVTQTDTIDYVEKAVKEYIRDTILPAMRKEYAGASVEMLQDLRLFPFNADENHPFTKLAREVTGCRVINKMAGGTEAGYFQEELGIPTVIVGCGGWGAHMANEYTTSEYLDKCSSITCELVRRCTCERTISLESKL